MYINSYINFKVLIFYSYF